MSEKKIKIGNFLPQAIIVVDGMLDNKIYFFNHILADSLFKRVFSIKSALNELVSVKNVSHNSQFQVISINV